jgi:cell division protein FtsZ
VRGARGILINITGSSQLGLHDVNEACTLIREAAENDDVQINFGVVMNDSMGDEVKITVIATGFTRENLPAIHRKTQTAEPVAAAPEPEPERVIEMPVPVAVQPPALPEELDSADPGAYPAYVEPERTMAAAASAPAAGFDDLEVPPVLRRDRRFLH